MKCFIGLPAAPSVINKLVDAQDRALSFDAGARPVPKENFHLTLAFIGEIEPDKARLIAQLLPLTTDFSFVLKWLGSAAAPVPKSNTWLGNLVRFWIVSISLTTKAVLNRISPFFGNRIWRNRSFSILLNGRFCVRESLNLD